MWKELDGCFLPSFLCWINIGSARTEMLPVRRKGPYGSRRIDTPRWGSVTALTISSRFHSTERGAEISSSPRKILCAGRMPGSFEFETFDDICILIKTFHWFFSSTSLDRVGSVWLTKTSFFVSDFTTRSCRSCSRCQWSRHCRWLNSARWCRRWLTWSGASRRSRRANCKMCRPCRRSNVRHCRWRWLPPGKHPHRVPRPLNRSNHAFRHPGRRIILRIRWKVRRWRQPWRPEPPPFRPPDLSTVSPIRWWVRRWQLRSPNLRLLPASLIPAKVRRWRRRWSSGPEHPLPYSPIPSRAHRWQHPWRQWPRDRLGRPWQPDPAETTPSIPWSALIWAPCPFSVRRGPSIRGPLADSRTISIGTRARLSAFSPKPRPWCHNFINYPSTPPSEWASRPVLFH